MGLFDESSTTDSSPFSNDDELSQISNDWSEDPQARKMAKQLQTQNAEINKAGYNPDDTQPRHSLLSDLLDTLDAPRQGVAGVVDAALRGDIFGQDAEGNDVGTGWERGQRENITTSDILRRNHLIENPIARGVAGFAGDVLTDPLTYLSFGSSVAERAGGKALTEAGQLLKSGAFEKAGAATGDIFKANESVDNAFRAASKYQDNYKLLQDLGGAAEVGPQTVAVDAQVKRLSELSDHFKDYFSPEEVTGTDIFEKPKLRVGINLPFLGHLQDANAPVEEIFHAANEAAGVTDLAQQPGIVGQAFRAAGKAFKPGRLGVDLDISPGLVQAMNNINTYTNVGLTTLGTQLGKLEKAPLIGTPIQWAEAAGAKAAKAYKLTTEALQKTFARKFLIGGDANDALIANRDFKSSTKLTAANQVVSTLGESVKDGPLMRDLYLQMDGLSADAKKILEGDDRFKGVQTLLEAGKEVSPGDLSWMTDKLRQNGVDFESSFQNYIKSPNILPEHKELLLKTKGLMDNMARMENEAGINYDQLAYYVTHRYLNRSAGGATDYAKSLIPGFTKKRVLDGAADTFKERGLVADSDLPKLLQYRIEQGLNAIADRNFFKRLTITEGVDKQTVQNLAREAAAGNESAKQVLGKWNLNVPPPNTAEFSDAIAHNELYSQFMKSTLAGDHETAAVIQSHMRDAKGYMNEQALAEGHIPLDNRMPDPDLGELGESVTVGNKQTFLPKAIADSYKETVASRDILKDKLKDSPFLSATLGLMDHATSIMRKAVTLPWPAYWGQNLIGDRFRQVMNGIHGMDPGVPARVYSVLKGESSIVNKYGVKIGKQELDRAIKEFGLNYTFADHIGTTQAFADMNLDKYLQAGKKSLRGNLLSSEPGSKAAAWMQAKNTFQNTFDGYQRVNHFVHRFEQGDTLADAAKSANELYFNYRDMSPVEQSLFRRFYMFYGYMSKATKTSLTDLVTNPGALTVQMHGSKAMAELFSDPQAAPTADEHDYKLLSSLPSEEQLSHIIGRTPEGKPIFARGFGAPVNSLLQQVSLQTPRNFSVGELLSSVKDSAVGTIRKQFATANPILNAAAQQVAGKNLYFDKPLNAEFLRKLPDWTAEAERLSAFSHTDLPNDISDDLKSFLGAYPDGKGRLVADAGKMWVLTNLIPGLSRTVSTAGAFSNDNISTSQALLRSLAGVNISDQDISRSYLASRLDESNKFMNDNSINKKAKLADQFQF